MGKITIDGLGSTIEWTGPGTYVAKRMRGPLDFQKVPEGTTVQNNATYVVKDFASEPASVQAPERRQEPRWS